RLLGDDKATAELLARLEKSEDVDERAGFISTLGILHDPNAIAAVAKILADTEEDDKLRGVAAFALAELADDTSKVWSESLSTDLAYSTMGWTLESPFGDGSGVLDMRWW
ncbi:MAG: HEAT repeat protein, partial [Planctomycetota bacterium]